MAAEPVVVITGGTAGVGRATARRFAASGARLAVLARGKDGRRATRRELSDLGARATLAIRCDVADAEQVAGAAARVERELGPIDIWINNAMTTVFGEFSSVDPAEYERVTRVTYLGFVWGTRAALAHMIPHSGRVGRPRRLSLLDHGTQAAVSMSLTDPRRALRATVITRDFRAQGRN